MEWNALRKAINMELLTYKVNEDKLMGPYFISKKNLQKREMIDPTVLTRIFKNKVIMYLFDDAAKQKRITLFGGCDEKAKNQYSKICREFDTKGVYIFCEGISSQFIDNGPEDDGDEFGIFARTKTLYTGSLVKEFHCSEEKTVRILKRLKEYGVLKAVKAKTHRRISLICWMKTSKLPMSKSVKRIPVCVHFCWGYYY